jgi:hypothetical protein
MKQIEEPVADGVRRWIGEFWTSGQRQASSLHEVSYRACFKPQLPRFFIERLTEPRDVVYDPFMGRGTTIIEAALLGRNVIGNDINPLSGLLTKPRLHPPTVQEVEERLQRLNRTLKTTSPLEYSMFFHPATEKELRGLRSYLLRRNKAGLEDSVDRWIRMVATNRLTGHSKGFFSVYTLPPNQAATPEQQIKINRKLRQKPEYRDVRAMILKKTKSLLKELTPHQRMSLNAAGESAVILSEDARSTQLIPHESIQLTVTSPPFLDIVNYAQDNWLRCWFNGIDAKEIAGRIAMSRTIEQWSAIMRDVFKELHRITRPNGYIAFEVGEVRKRTIKLDEVVVPLGLAAGFRCEGVLINQQKFTKTANIWGIKNNERGTNTNRIVLFRKAKD